MPAVSRRCAHMLVIVAVSMVATACGILPGTSSGGDEGTAVQAGSGAVVLPTPTATALPTARPTPTPRPTATPEPTPTPTPWVPDTYTDLLLDVRALFSSPELEEDIGRIVPLPFSIPIPPDASLERIELVYRDWDVWKAIIGGFPPVDTPADVWITAAFVTGEGVDDLREAFGRPPLEDGYEVVSDDSEPGRFSDVRYELNGGTLQRGRDGEARVTIFGQADGTFVEVSVKAELEQNTSPRLAEWSDLFVVPFSGGFQDWSANAVRAPEGIAVGSGAVWLIGSKGSSQAAIMETLAAEYPANGMTMENIVDTGPRDPSVATIQHLTGATGTTTVDFETNYTWIDFSLASAPG